MTVDELLQEVRYQIHDTDKVEYTDSELISYVNDALRFISNELIRCGSALLLKRTSLSLTDGQAGLPADFVKEQAVLDSQGYVLQSLAPSEPVSRYGYKIVGSTIYSDNSTLELYYFASFPSVSALNEDVPVPDYMLSLVKQIVVFLALNRNEYSLSVEAELIKLFQGQVMMLANTGGQNMERTLPFVV